MRLVNILRVTIIGLLFSSPFHVLAQGRIALVIDDLGNQLGAGQETIASAFVQTVAIMPGRPHSAALAEKAQRAGLEVIIHLPMANLTDFPLGKFGLYESDSFYSFSEVVRSAIASMPQAVGLSNHMGSRLTQDRLSMQWLMAVLKSEGLYFLDSRTVHTTVAWQVAESHGVPWAMRHVFLDHEKNMAFVERQWEMAVERASLGENVIVIGHPYPVTLAFLNSVRAQVMAADIQFVPLSEFLNYPEAKVKQPNITNGFQFMLR